jgi:hypothetical protein
LSGLLIPYFGYKKANEKYYVFFTYFGLQYFKEIKITCGLVLKL